MRSLYRIPVCNKREEVKNNSPFALVDVNTVFPLIRGTIVDFLPRNIVRGFTVRSLQLLRLSMIMPTFQLSMLAAAKFQPYFLK